MTTDPRSLKQIEVLVLRAEKPDTGFRWELRQYSKGMPIMSSGDVFGSQADARRAGLAALARYLSGDGEPTPPDL